MSMALKVSKSIEEKLRDKHSVSVREVKQCFANVQGGALEDTRAKHKTDPATQWFISETDKGRSLKVIFMLDNENNIIIKSAYPPEEAAVKIYENNYPAD